MIPGIPCPNQRREEANGRRAIATSSIPQAPEGSDPVTRISVFVSPGKDRNDATVINVIHYSLRGNAYERPKQYQVYTRGLNDGSAMAWPKTFPTLTLDGR